MAAADVPISILLEKLQKLLDLANGRLIFPPRLRNHVGSAVNELKRILTFIEAEEARLRRRPRLLPTVYSAEETSSLLRTVYSAEYILETFLQRRRKGIIDLRTISIAPWTQKQLISKLKKIAKSFEAVPSEFPPHQTPEFFDDTGRSPQVSALNRDSRRGLSRNDHDDVLVGRKDDEEKLVSQLIKDDVKSLCVISVVSEEVVGKTTLARKVYNRLDVRQHFQCRAWLHVPKVTEHKDLLIAILKQIRTGVLKGVEIMKENELSTMLFKNLMELRFLIVLDDVCELDDWLVFVRPLADAANGSRIIVTTRDSKLASEVDPWSHPLNLKPLKEEDSWKLFKNKAALAGRPDGTNTSATELETIREKVLKLCHGLPPAIVLLGGLLSTVKLNEWYGVIDHLAHPGDEVHHQFPDHLLRNIIDLSYRILRSELKLCFLYLALFPKAYEIPVRRLLQLWVAEGFVKMSSNESSVNEGNEASVNKGNESSNEGTEASINEGNQSSNEGTEASVNKGTEPEDMAGHYLEELVCRNMIEIARWKEDGSPKTCRMPSFLRDVFFPEAEDIGFLHAHRCKSDCTSAVSPPDDRSNVIRRLAYKCFDTTSTSESQPHPQPHRCSSDVSFKAQKQGRSNGEIDTLLKTIISKRRGFVLMKVLDLEGAFRPLLPVKLGKLQNLRYIGLRWTSIDSCPKSIGDLPFLETLDLKYTNITTLPSSIWKAKNLRHLYITEVSIPKPSSSSSSEKSNLQTLTGLVIDSENHLPKKKKKSENRKEYWLSQFTGLRKLGLTCHSKSTVKETVECISQLGKLQTFKLRSRDHQFGQPSEIELPTNLENHKSLSNLYLFGVRMDGIDNLPRNLKTLTLSMMELEIDSMRVLGNLERLNVLKLFGCSYVGTKLICFDEEFLQLRVLKLWRLEKLEKLAVQKGAMPRLVELEIRGCEKLEKLYGLKQLTTSLKELSLTDMKREFVADVKHKLKRLDRSHILLTNDWKPLILPCMFHFFTTSLPLYTKK